MNQIFFITNITRKKQCALYSSTDRLTPFFSESAHQHEVEQNDARRARNFRIRRHLSVDDTETQIQNTETSQVGTFKSPGRDSLPIFGER